MLLANFNKDRPSFAVSLAAKYSASGVLRATQFCWYERHDIAPPLYINTQPVWLFLLSMSPAPDLLTKGLKRDQHEFLNEAIFGYKLPG